jgi:hypothetical protein
MQKLKRTGKEEQQATSPTEWEEAGIVVQRSLDSLRTEQRPLAARVSSR